MFKYKKSESSNSFQVWSFRNVSLDSTEIHKIRDIGPDLLKAHCKKLKAAPGWRLVRLSRRKRLLVKLGSDNSASIAVALWRKDLDRVCDQFASNLYQFDGGVL